MPGSPDELPPPLHEDDGLQEEQDVFDAEVAGMSDEERFQRTLALMDGRDYVAPAKGL